VLPSRVVGLAMRAERKVIDHRRFEVSQLTDCVAVCFGHGQASSRPSTPSCLLPRRGYPGDLA
jgi:hypothetical protein